LLVALFCAAAVAQNHSAQNIRGIYLYSEHPENPADNATLLQALGVPGVDGLALLVGWNNVEPSRGVFAWDPANTGADTLDQLLAAAIAKGKKVDLAIRAGQDTPCWVFQGGCGKSYTGTYGGATRLNFTVAAVQGAGGQGCNEISIAAPWDAAFQSEWSTMLSALAQHLRNTYFPDANGNPVRAYDAVVAVRLTGVNRTTAEFRLPAEILPQPCYDRDGNAHYDTNSVATWLLQVNPPYRPARLLNAWDAITTMFQTNFPDKTFTLPIIPDASGSSNTPDYPFPMIDNFGRAYQPPWPTDTTDPNYVQGVQLNTNSFPGVFPPVPDQNYDLLQLASQKFPGHLVVAYQNLDLRFPAQIYIVYAAQTWGTMAGFQTNDYIGPFQQAACGGGTAHPVACDSATYLQLLELGIYPCRTNTAFCTNQNLQSSYIEVLPPDALAFPDAIMQAHIELHRSMNASAAVRDHSQNVMASGRHRATGWRLGFLR